MTDSATPPPPPVEAFSDWAPFPGGQQARIDIAGLAIELAGLPAGLFDEVTLRYRPYLSARTGHGRPLRVEVLEAPFDYFLTPGFATRNEIYRMSTALNGEIFRTASYRLASWIDVGRRAGQIALSRGDFDPMHRAFENFLRSSIAWLAFTAGGILLHAAGIVRAGRGYVFYGRSGAGKSTLAAQSRQGEVLSDDLTLILRRPEGLVVSGSPFRGTYTGGTAVTGAFPLAGMYRLRKDSRAVVLPDDGGCFADLLGNLPFLVDQMPRRPELIDAVRGLVLGVRLRSLHFVRDQDFWAAIDAGES